MLNMVMDYSQLMLTVKHFPLNISQQQEIQLLIYQKTWQQNKKHGALMNI